MAHYSDGDRVTRESAVDLSQKRFHGVKTDANGRLVLAGAADANLLGILDDGGRVSGDSCDVVLFNGQGTFKVKTGANLAKDALITTDANGQAVTATSGQRAFGKTLYASNSGDIVEYIKVDRVVA